MQMTATERRAFEKAFLEICHERKIDPSNLNESTFRSVSIAAHKRVGSLREAATSALSSRVRTGLLKRIVLPQVTKHNQMVCRSCPVGKYYLTSDNAEACKACGCSGKFLESKWSDPEEACPEGLWSNKRAEAVDVPDPEAAKRLGLSKEAIAEELAKLGHDPENFDLSGVEDHPIVNSTGRRGQRPLSGDVSMSERKS